MLPARLLDVRRLPGGAVTPAWLLPRDEVWLRELLAEAAASADRRADAAEERILDLVAPLARRHGRSRRVVEAVWTVERRRFGSRVASPIPPVRIRRVLFELGAERSRDEAIASAAAELGVDAPAMLSALFADRAGARLLVAPPAARCEAELAATYNLALVQGLLARATEVAVEARANLTSIVGFAKLLGLMMCLEETARGTTRIEVSGPLALFHATLKYGRALAKWFESVVATPGWSVEAKILLGGQQARLSLDGAAPLARTHALPRPHDSALEARLERDLRRLGSRWRLVREGAVVRSGSRLFFPDFLLESGDARVVVEVVGFWTPAYLASKLELLRAVRAPFVMCVDARHAAGELASDPRVLPFRRARIDARALVEACERALQCPPQIDAGGAPSSVRHYMVIPASPAMANHAERAGALRAAWREEIFSDVTGDGAVRLVPRGSHPSYGPQIGLLGRRFYVEANPHDRREDALFVHHVMPASPPPTVAARPYSASWSLASPSELSRAPELASVRPVVDAAMT